MNTVARIVEDTWPEGYVTHAICTDIQSALDLISANRPLFEDAIARNDLGVEEIPLGMLSTDKSVHGKVFLSDVERLKIMEVIWKDGKPDYINHGK